MVLAAPVQPDAKDRIPPLLVSRILAHAQGAASTTSSSTPRRRFDEHVLAGVRRDRRVLLVATLDVPTLKNVKVAVETLDLLNFATRPPPPGAQPRRRQGRARPPTRSRAPRHDDRPCRSRPRPRSPPRPTRRADRARAARPPAQPGDPSTLAGRLLAGRAPTSTRARCAEPRSAAARPPTSRRPA